MVARVIWADMLSIAVTYFITLCLFPGLESEIRHCVLGEWLPILVMAVFNLSDFVGKVGSLPALPSWPWPTRKIPRQGVGQPCHVKVPTAPPGGRPLPGLLGGSQCQLRLSGPALPRLLAAWSLVGGSLGWSSRMSTDTGPQAMRGEGKAPEATKGTSRTCAAHCASPAAAAAAQAGVGPRCVSDAGCRLGTGLVLRMKSLRLRRGGHSLGVTLLRGLRNEFVLPREQGRESASRPSPCYCPVCDMGGLTLISNRVEVPSWGPCV